ncbi:hypothetical protein ADP71_27020 [Vitreoscilla sp. C1]|uniref:RcnB family protein n=1 Tax=Vitreoscilla sp. (strain C1) TaxID=96942 RepID=UPI00148EDF0C|nr:RcnB family protein [Vitreoscilla sp. C1]AUZ05978.2 hypothetical protein ADP71_27020 [Vitreoscilla sp. C1]
MKKLITTAIIASLMSMVAIPAMAAPQHSQSHSSHTKPHPSYSHKNNNQYQDQQKIVPKKTQAHQTWKRGQVLNKKYRGKAYWADSKEQRHLPKAGKNQRWVKVDQNYILINTLSNVILSVFLR